MRNLKKILALVLALIMSLSLMATAGATDFKDDADVSDTYRQAVEVLSELGVFNGDQNGQFNPGQPIKRSEVAAILYRIATGDIGLEGNKTYAPYNQFPDVSAEDWYAGYVTYCANAGYIKGRNTGKFDAKDDVTGYEVLAMILRAVGYDKNNEFVGSNWQLNTASIAREKGVLANVLEDPAVRLSEPATREVVAELLFRSSLLPQVTWNAATLSYREEGETLAKQNLGMEPVTGVVMANKWANINENGAVVLAEGKTELKPEGETKNLTLDIDTDLDAVGCAYTAYIQNGTRVLGDLEYCDDLNTVVDNGGAATTVARLMGSLKDTDETSYFLNYSEDLGTEYMPDHLIRYAIAKSSCGEAWTEYITGLDCTNPKAAGTDPVDGHSYEVRSITINGTATECYVVAIQPKNWLEDEDLEIMRRIFYTADRLNEPNQPNTDSDFVLGEVYVGTNSYEDVSDWNGRDTLSWDQFVDLYLKPTDVQYVYAGCDNGESLRIIDNDANGVADYVFKVEYWQDKAVDTEKGELVYYELDLDDYYYNTFNDEIVEGDVVNYTSIDGRVTVWKADKLTGKVVDKNFEKTTITITDDDTNYGQSEIYNNTYMTDRIMNTLDATDYYFYLDEFGYIRTYELAQGTQYALLTEIYNTTGQAYNYVNSNIYTAEVVIGDEPAHEYRIANANPFISAYAWTSRISNYYHTDGDLNYLQPAIAHLGTNGENAMKDVKLYTGATVGQKYNYVSEDWGRGVFTMAGTSNANTYWGLTGNKALAGTPTNGVFDYGPVNEVWLENIPNDGSIVTKGGSVGHSFSFTNVAVYGLGDDNTISLRSASKLKLDKNGNQLYYWQDPTYDPTADPVVAATYPWGNKTTAPNMGIGRTQKTEAEWLTAYEASLGRDLTRAETDAIIANCLVQVYDVDYVQLQNAGIAAGKAHYYIDGTYSDNYNALENGYVNATVETEFYIAMPNKVLHYVGYDKLPTINSENIRAAYAVATNTYSDASDHDYWIANVIVIEVEQLDNPYDSISLMYYNPFEVSGAVRNVRSLNNLWRTYQPESDQKANIPVVPKTSNGGSASWGNHSWTSSEYGFYEIYDSAYADGTLNAGDVQQLPALATTDWAGHGIYAGTIQRIYGLTESEYIDVDLQGRPYTGTPINDTSVRDVSVTTGSDAVPIYRVNGTSTSDLRLGKRVATSDVQLGDELILVYSTNGATRGTLAYIVDLGTRTAANGTVIYSAANWLWNNYNAIIGSRTARGYIQFTTNFNEYLTAAGKVETFPKAAGISVPGTTRVGTFYVDTRLTSAGGDMSYSGTIPAGYTLVAVKSADDTLYTVDDTNLNNVEITAAAGYDLREGVVLNLIFDFNAGAPGAQKPIIAKAQENGTGLPEGDWKIIGIYQAAANSSGRAASLDKPEAGDDAVLYFDVKSSYDVENVTITAPADIADTYTAKDVVGQGPISEGLTAGCVRWCIEFTMPEDVINLTINAADENVKVTLPANTTATYTPSTGILKGAPLGGKVITLAPDTGYSVPTSVTVSVNGKVLEEGAAKDYTYDNSTDPTKGVITFKAAAGDATGPIVITGTAAEKTAVLTLTGDDAVLSTAVVKQGDNVIGRNKGAWTWTLQQGIAYTISVSAPAQAGKRVAVTVGGADATLNATTGLYEKSESAPSDGTAISKAIAVTYTEVFNLTITATGATGATITVTGGNVSHVADTNVWTVDKDSTPTIKVTPASGKKLMPGLTATGMTLSFADPSGDNTTVYSATAPAVTADATIAITCKGYYPADVTMAAAPTNVTYASEGKVTLTVANGGATATGTLSVTVAVAAFQPDSTDSNKYKAVVTIAPPAAANGGSYALSGAGYDATTGKLTIVSDQSAGAVVPTGPMSVNLTLTFTPDGP